MTDVLTSAPRESAATPGVRVFSRSGVVVYRTDQNSRALDLIGAGLGVALMPASYRSSNTQSLSIQNFNVHRTIDLRWRTEGGNDNTGEFLSIALSHGWPKHI